MICPLCNNFGSEYETVRHSIYYKCPVCAGLYLDTEKRLDIESEEKRYRQHNNDVTDQKYIRFVSPITDSIKNDYNIESVGLDFGAGPGPVITKILRESGYRVHLYDPIFHCNEEVLQKKYDFIACCEVIEHFYNPRKEFSLLSSLLKPDGKLYCMTELYDEKTDFSKWRYRQDATHVFFYQNFTINWIKNNLHFKNAEIEGRLIVFSV